MTPPRPQLEVVVDLEAIAHNTRLLVTAADGAAVMAVVKADGYGHGAVEVARTALASGASELGVTTIDEALQLREAGIEAPILTWLNSYDADYQSAIAADLEIAVASRKHLSAVVDAADVIGKTAIVSVKVDTGLNRNGASPVEYPELVKQLKLETVNGKVRLRSMFSHLVYAGLHDHPTVDLQKKRFEDAVKLARDNGLEPELLHMANSAATLLRPDLHYDIVRPGIALYGLSPTPRAGELGLRPAMTFRTRVALVKQVAAGEGVSYGHDWTAPIDTHVALLPVGYADGLPRALGGRIEILVGDRRYPSVGRVCMDQMVIDLGPDAPTVTEGDSGVLFGPPQSGAQSAQDWATLLGTIHYEVVTGVRGRAVRSFLPAKGDLER